MKHLLLLVGLYILPITISAQSDYIFPEDIKPLIKTRWGQGFPFNLLCPQIEKDGETLHQLAGCGPVAMAQVINYHQFPNESPDMEYIYEWRRMYHQATKVQSKEELVAVGKLISDCGVTAFTDYGESASSTNIRNMMGALKRLFGYSKYITLYNRNNFQTPARDTLYRQLLFQELKAGRPIIYRAFNSEKKEGHLFIIDGCKGNKVHVNFGWAGKDDGYYSLDDLNKYSTEQIMMTEVADSTYQPAILPVNLSIAGTLNDKISPLQFLKTQHLKVSGPINDADIAFLRQMSREGVLSSIDLADCHLENLPDTAFANCLNLSYIALPHNTQRIGQRAFYSCRNLSIVDFNEGLSIIYPGAFSGCNSLLSVELPQTARIIYSGAFNSCSSLFHVIIPEGVWFIDNYAFSYCKCLLSLVLPSSVKKLGKDILKDCPRLKRVIISSDNPYFEADGLSFRKKNVTEAANILR